MAQKGLYSIVPPQEPALLTMDQDPLIAPLIHVHTFTLTFPDGQIAILEVHGASDQDSARAVARQAVRYRQTIILGGEQIRKPINYTVTDGDTTGGHADYFYSWRCIATQHSQVLQPPQSQTEAHEWGKEV